MGLRLMNIMMEVSLKECMRMVKGIVLGSLHARMGIHMKATEKMTINMDTEYSDGVMEIADWTTRRIAREMAQGLNRSMENCMGLHM